MSRNERYRVLLIRSGATEWDEQDYLPGIADLPLCDRDRDEFRFDPGLVGSVSMSTVVSAGDEASTETADRVARTLGIKARRCDALADVDLGLWQGLRMDELRDRTPKIYRQWHEDPLSLSPPEGESLRNARERLMNQVLRTTEKHCRPGKDQAIAIVLRPLAMALIRSRLLGDSSLPGWCKLASAPEYEWHEIPASRAVALRAVPAGAA